MPNTIVVTSTADSGAGSLRNAIASAQNGDTIKFNSSLANQTIVLNSKLEIPTGKSLTIDGAGTSGLSISGNNKHQILLLHSTSATPTSLSVKNLTLMDGYTNDRGGAISTEHQGKLTVENVTFKSNTADNGGGAIFSAYEGTLTVNNCKFNNNEAVAGNDERGAGAIAFWGPKECTVTNSDFVGNRGINGGAINSLNGKLTVKNCDFIDNDTTAATFDSGQPNPSLRGYGGAIYTDRASASNEPSGTIRITDSVFDGNKGRGEGGAAYLYTGTQDNVIIESTQFKDNEVLKLANGNDGNGGGVVVLSNGVNKGLTINNTSFANNTASGQGGGLWTMDAPATITNTTFSGNKVLGSDYSRVGGGMTLYSNTDLINCTIANNFAGWVGGGISAADGKTVRLKNTIFSKNTADNGPNDWGIQQHTNREFIDLGGNIQFPPKQTTNWNDYNATGSIKLVDPKLGVLQDNGGGLLTHALQSGSPAINSGIISGAPATDQRGFDRDTQPDIGAFEFGATDDGGGGDNDPIIGNSSNNLLKGTDANNTIKGLDGNDTLIGYKGDDRLIGGNGSDQLTGGAGKDVLTGGAGKDKFVFNSLSEKVDRIADFKASDDVLNLNKIIDGTNFSSSQPFKDYIKLVQQDGRTIVQVDASGNKTPNQFETLVTLTNVNAGSLSASNFIF